MIPLANKPRDPVRTERAQNEIAFLGTVWDHLMQARIDTRELIIELNGFRLMADSHRGDTAINYSVSRLRDDRQFETIWSVHWNRYSFSFNGNSEQYEKDLALLKMFVG